MFEVGSDEECPTLKHEGVVGDADVLSNAANEESRLLEFAFASPEEELTFHVAVESAPFDFSRFRGASAEERAQLIDERQGDAKAGLSAARQAVEGLGGTIESETWLVPGLVVRARGRIVPNILALPEVLTASLSERVSPDGAYEGRRTGFESGLNEMDCDGWPVTTLRTANSNDAMRKAVQLKGSGEISGKCLSVKLYGTSVPSGGASYYGAVYTYNSFYPEH